MGKYKKRYRALKDDVSDLLIALGTENFQMFGETFEIIIKYYFKNVELYNIIKNIDDINAKKGEQDATQL